VGDLHTVALVATDGTIDSCCLPRFDSPAVFASLLDADRGGCFAVRAEAARTRQLYMPDTNVLVTRFLGTDSVGEVVDFMVPRRPGGPLTHPGPLLVRRVRAAGRRLHRLDDHWSSAQVGWLCAGRRPDLLMCVSAVFDAAGRRPGGRR
jgi:hypothetical protein